MANIAARPEVGKIQSEIRPIFDALIVLSVEMTIAFVVSFAEFIEYLFNWRRSKSRLSEYAD